jgi:hypothetical protein
MSLTLAKCDLSGKKRLRALADWVEDQLRTEGHYLFPPLMPWNMRD